ncbi:MAG: hypothetical protein LBR45_03800 [Bacteroidales bacterium]|jgi:hypothetical protein|nr:hypothetical protein [Bacteroidales bacterium]
MKKKFYLPGLNSLSKKTVEKIEELERIENQIDEETPLLYQFIHTHNDFYRENFNGLEKCKKREKRLLEFETPNRAKITHEYDMSLNENFNFDNYYYLFNPRNRLSWLKIRQEGDRILIASNDEIKDLVKKKLKEELDRINEADKFFDYIWKNQSGYPCFIKLDRINKTKFLLEAEYFDSVKSIDKKKANIFCPFEERSVFYEYEALRNYSSWLYIRAPKEFDVLVNKEKIEYNRNANQIDFYDDEKDNEHSDPEIKTLTIINTNNLNPIVKLCIDIEIPKSKKMWFNTIYWISFAVCFILGLNLINKIWISIKPLFYTSFTIGDLVNKNSGIIIAIIAGIIATRGWLITEETIFKKYSNYLTWILMLLVVLSIISQCM